MGLVLDRLVKIAGKLFVLLLLSSFVLGEIDEFKKSGISRRALPKWLAELPDWVPLWMKVSASEYRGYPTQVKCAVTKMAKAYNDMRTAESKNCDSYFHCRGSYDAATCGVYAATVAGHISFHREWRLGGVDGRYDRRADVFGLSGGSCINEYKYKTFGTRYECNLPWFYQK